MKHLKHINIPKYDNRVTYYQDGNPLPPPENIWETEYKPGDFTTSEWKQQYYGRWDCGTDSNSIFTRPYIG